MKSLAPSEGRKGQRTGSSVAMDGAPEARQLERKLRPYHAKRIMRMYDFRLN